MQTKQLAIAALIRFALLMAFVAPVFAASHLLGAPELATSGAVVVVVLIVSWFQEDLIDRIAPRFGVTQLNGR
jgi:hypothetical protein